MSTPSSAAAVELGKNARTVIGGPWLVESPWSTERLFFHHFEQMRALRQINVATSGYAVFGIFANRRVETYGWLSPGSGGTPAFWVFGRHSQCGLSLKNDPTVALRHLLVRLGSDDTIFLDDLGTKQGFDVDGVGRCRAGSTDGLVCLRVGSYALLFLPVAVSLRRTTPRLAWETMTAMTLEERSDFERRTPPGLLGGVGDIGTPLAVVPSEAGEVVGTVIVSRRELGTIYPVRDDELDRGIILGRYRRCHLPMARRAGSSAVSRVHALIIRSAGRIWAMDLASTNGIRVDGRRVRCAEITGSTTIELSDGYRVHWRPEPPPVARPRVFSGFGGDLK